MAFPVGVSVAIIEAGRAFTSVGSDVSMSAKVTPIFRAVGGGAMKRIVHAATGHPMLASTEEFKAEAGSVLSFAVPHVDQPGWQAPSGEAYTMWYYAVEITARVGNGRNSTGHVWKQNVQPLVGQDFIDLDLVADGPTGEPVTAPQAYVTDVEGQTGSVVIGPIVGAAIDQAVLDGRIPLPEIDVTETAPGVYDLGSGQTVYGLTAAQELPAATIGGLDLRYAPTGALTEVPDADVASLVTDGAETKAALDANYAPVGALTSVPDSQVAGIVSDYQSSTSQALQGVYWKRTADALRLTVGDVAGLADVVPVLRAASDFCFNNGIRRLYLPPATMEYRSRWYLDARGKGGLEIIGHGEDTVFRHTGGTADLALIHAAGTDGTKTAVTADIPAGSRSAAFPSAVASTLAKGDCIGFESTRLVFDVNNEAGMQTRASEIRKVANVSGNTVTFDSPTIWPYNLAESAVVWKMNPINGIKLRDFVITSSDPLVNKWKGIQIEKATNVEVTGVTFRNAGGGLFLYDVIDGLVSNVNADRLPNYTNFLGYGVCVAGRSANILVDKLRGRGTRHVFTTLSDERAGVYWGGPRHITVRDGVGEAFPGSFSVFDTHPQGYDITFDNCHASGGAAGSGDSCGFQIRSVKTQLNNCVVRETGAGGVRMHTMAIDLQINGGEYSKAQTFGITLNENGRISNAWVHLNGASGVILGARSAKARVTNCRIENNAQISSGYGVHDQTTGNQAEIVIGPGNIIPKGTSQAISVLSPKGDQIIYGNVMRGYGAGVDGVGGTIAPTVVRVQNITD